MPNFEFTAVKLETDDVRSCEAFFSQVFGFQVVHRYGGGDAPFEEIVMTIGGEPGMMLKFIRQRDHPVRATGGTVQIVLEDAEAALEAAVAAGAKVKLRPTDYPEAGVRMAVGVTDQGLELELVQRL